MDTKLMTNSKLKVKNLRCINDIPSQYGKTSCALIVKHLLDGSKCNNQTYFQLQDGANIFETSEYI